jgi:hypothetical protein
VRTAGFEPATSGISGRRLCRLGYVRGNGPRKWCARGDSNPHCPRFEGGASCRLGYARGVRLWTRTRNREGLSLAALPVGVGGRPPSPRLRRDRLAKAGAPGWIRTSNLRYLRPTPPPIGLRGRCIAFSGNRGHRANVGKSCRRRRTLPNRQRSQEHARSNERRRGSGIDWGSEGGVCAAAAQRSSVLSEAIAEVDVIVGCGPSSSWRP